MRTKAGLQILVSSWASINYYKLQTTTNYWVDYGGLRYGAYW